MSTRHLARWTVVLAAAGLALAAVSCRSEPRQSKAAAVVNGHSLRLEVADTDASRTLGLSNRRTLPADQAMLFVFDHSQNLRFHMQDCYIPLDIAFLDETGRIINLDTMAVENDPAHPRRIYLSDRPARYALEANAGTWRRIGARAGMDVTLSSIE